MRGLVKGAAAAVGIGAGVAGVVGAAAMQDETVRDESGRIEEAGELGAFRIRLGDCFDDFSLQSEMVESVPGVPCDGPHDNETYAVFDLPDAAAYPGDAAVDSAGETGCWDRFEAVFQERYEESRLWFSFLVPSQESWEGIDDREVLCFVYLPDQPLTGSVLPAALRSEAAASSQS